jgi:hypothetical protein
MAHKKAGGSSRNGRDSESKRLGLKAFGGELEAVTVWTALLAAVIEGDPVGLSRSDDGLIADRQQIYARAPRKAEVPRIRAGYVHSVRLTARNRCDAANATSRSLTWRNSDGGNRP